MKTASSRIRAAQVLATALLALGSGAEAQFSLYQAAGDDALGFVRVDSPSEFFGKVDGLVSPLGFSSRMALPMLGQKLFANPTLSGMDLSQPWLIVLLDPTSHTWPWAFSFQAANSAQFVAGIGGTGLRAFAIDPATAASRIKEFTQEITEFDREGYNAALEAGQNPDLQNFRHKETRRLFIGVSNRLVFGADDRNIVDQALRTEAASPQTILDGDLVVRLRPGALAGIVSKLETDAAGTGAAVAPMSTIPGLPDMDVLLDAATAGLGQLTAIEQAIELGAGRLHFRVGLETAAGSNLRAWAARQPGRPESLTAFVPEDSIGVAEYDIAFSPDDLRAVMNLAGALQPSTESAPAPPAAVPDDILEAWATVMSGPVLTAYLPNPPGQGGVRIVTVLRVEDTDKARDILRQVLGEESNRRWFTAGRIPGGIAAEFRTEVAQFQGYPVDRLGFMEPGADADPVTRQTWEGLKASTGGSPVIYATCVPGYVVQTMGAQGLPTLNQTVSRLMENRPTRFTTSTRYQSHLGRLPANAQMKFWFAGGEYLKAMTSALPSEMALPFDPSTLVGSRQLDVSGHMRVEGNTIAAELVLPAGDIVAIAQQAMSGQFGAVPTSP